MRSKSNLKKVLKKFPKCLADWKTYFNFGQQTTTDGKLKRDTRK